MFGSSPPQNEQTEFNPQSPYGISKVAAFYPLNILGKLTDYLRLMEFYSIMSHLERFKFRNKKNYPLWLGYWLDMKKIYLGDISTKRDWGHSLCQRYMVNLATS